MVMKQAAVMSGPEINKRYVENTVLFAINNLPQADETTLERFLELVNATGNFGGISHQQLIHKMNLLRKYVPGTSPYSLLALAELLGLELSANNNLSSSLKEINQ